MLMEITPQVADLQQSPLISTTSTILPPGAASPEEGGGGGVRTRGQSPGGECISGAGLDKTQKLNHQPCSQR